jgi:hypothetical protein
MFYYYGVEMVLFILRSEELCVCVCVCVHLIVCYVCVHLIVCYYSSAELDGLKRLVCLGT